MVMCFVPDCKHYSEKNDCKFFSFPKKNPKKIRSWLVAIRRLDREPSRYSLVCSCHFKDGKKENGPSIFSRNENKIRKKETLDKKKTLHLEFPETGEFNEKKRLWTEAGADADELEAAPPPPLQADVCPSISRPKSNREVALEAEIYFLRREIEELKNKNKTEMRMAPDNVGGLDSPGGGVGGAPSLSPPVAFISSSLPLIKEGGAPPPSEDDDLTSLTWLVQDKNILKAAVGGVQESPTSDYAEDSTSERGEGEGDSSCCSVNSGSPVPPSSGGRGGGSKKNKRIRYDPEVHVTRKPPYSLSCLIFMAIEDSPVKALSLKEIYAWILEHFPYFKIAPPAWQNSVRHNLSLNKCFCKVDKSQGKGTWMVDPVYRPNLVQALKKAHYHSYAITDTGSHRTTPTRNSQPPDSYSPADPSPDNAAAPVDMRSSSSSGLLSDPDLCRVLAAVAMAAVAPHAAEGDVGAELDDVDVAAAMFALKHGPRRVRMSIEQRKDENHKQMTAVISTTSKGKKKSKEEDETDVLITSFPSEDHTYSVEHTQALHTDTGLTTAPP